MKVLVLTLNDKQYTTGKLTTFLSKEALRIQKYALDLAAKGKEVQQETAEEDLDKINELLDGLLELKERKAWLICEIYGNKFSAEELEKCFSDEEIDAEINRIISGIHGVITKN